MTGHVTGTAAALAKRRQECEAAIRTLAPNDPVEANCIRRLRRQLGMELANLVLSVAALQNKARDKLGGSDANVAAAAESSASEPPIWWVTERSLQQASAWQVAKLKSGWLDDRLVYDLCCGIGGDARQLAQRGPLVAVDCDPLIAQMATANLDRTPATRSARVECADAANISIPAAAAIHIDPDRRADETRRTNPDDYRPNWPTVVNLVMKASAAIVKLAPAAKLDSLSSSEQLHDEMHRCWISLCGSVREQSLLVGDAIESAGLERGAKSAVSLDRNGAANRFAPQAAEMQMPGPSVASKPMSLLVDPCASIRAAGLTTDFAHTYNLHSLGNPSGFLTSDQPLSQAAEKMAISGRVVWKGSSDDRKLRRELRSRQVYPAVIKVRGTGHDPAILFKRYRSCGEIPVTLWIGRVGDRTFAAITE